MQTTNNNNTSLPSFTKTIALITKATTLTARTTLEVISVVHNTITSNSKLASQIDSDSLKDIIKGRAQSNEMSREYLRTGVDAIANIFSSDEEVKAKTKSAFDRAEAEVDEAEATDKATDKAEATVAEQNTEEVKPQA